MTIESLFRIMFEDQLVIIKRIDLLEYDYKVLHKGRADAIPEKLMQESIINVQAINNSITILI